MIFNIQLKPELEKKVKYIISKQDNAESFFQDFILYQISELEKAIINIEKDIKKYEKKYKISSFEFYKLFEEGKFGDEDDYMIWSGIYEMLNKNKAELKKIQW